MSLDPELLKQLIVTFKSELEEQTQIMVDCLLKIEKSPTTVDSEMLENIFRAAHSIKGAAKSIGIHDIGEIAHRVESIFSALKNQSIAMSPNITNLCLEAIDKINQAMQSFVANTPLPFDLPSFIEKLEKFDNNQSFTEKPVEKIISTEKSTHDDHQDSIRVPIKNLDKISSLMEEMQVNRIALKEMPAELAKLNHTIHEFSQLWKEIYSVVKDQKTTENITRALHSSNDHLVRIQQLTNELHKNMLSQVNDLSILSASL